MKEIPPSVIDDLIALGADVGAVAQDHLLSQLRLFPSVNCVGWPPSTFRLCSVTSAINASAW
jgi:hypothetical protein